MRQPVRYADGIALVQCTTGPMGVSPVLPGLVLPIDMNRDLQPVARFVQANWGIAVPKDSPYQTLADLIADLETAVRVGDRARAGQLEQAILQRLATEAADHAAVERRVRALMAELDQPAAGPLIRQLVDERRKLRDTIRADAIDEKAIRTQAAKVAALEADLAVERAHIAHEIKPVLTAEQLAKLKDWQVDIDEHIDGFLTRVAKRIAAD